MQGGENFSGAEEKSTNISSSQTEPRRLSVDGKQFHLRKYALVVTRGRQETLFENMPLWRSGQSGFFPTLN